MSRRRMRFLGAITVALVLTAACDDTDATAPSPSSLAGTYVATRLTSTTGTSASVNQLGRGASITLTLAASGATSGRVLVPDPVEPLDASLAGTWTLVGGDVELDHPADTFLRDMTFTVQGNTLVGDETFGDMRVVVTLTRQ
jgi:hypothetical protein